jgi:hypothetical protein
MLKMTLVPVLVLTGHLTKPAVPPDLRFRGILSDLIRDPFSRSYVILGHSRGGGVMNTTQKKILTAPKISQYLHVFFVPFLD